MNARLRAAQKFWEEAENRVWKVAREANLDAGLECAIDLDELDIYEILFEAFDDGNYIPSDAEIVSAIIEVLEG